MFKKRRVELFHCHIILIRFADKRILRKFSNTVAQSIKKILPQKNVAPKHELQVYWQDIQNSETRFKVKLLPSTPLVVS
jgi:hypothetical protein